MPGSTSVRISDRQGQCLMGRGADLGQALQVAAVSIVGARRFRITIRAAQDSGNSAGDNFAIGR
jgi:hypothetical protein